VADTTRPIPTDPDALIDAAAVRQMCGGISDMTLRRWIARGILPQPQHIERIRRWRRGAVLSALAAHREAPPPSPCPDGPAARDARRADADREAAA
jgi:predicted DNA-binding transcriptional regulator AlpA